jgi:hypothetical protein
MPNGSRILRRIANALEETISDSLAEAWYAVFFVSLGFQVVVEPHGKAGPDFEITRNGHIIIVEATRFRKVYDGPPEITLYNQFEITEYGDSARDIKKAYNKIVGKLNQIEDTEKTSILTIWNSDGDLEEIEMEAAIRHLRRDAGTKKILLPPNLAFIVFGPWDSHLTCYEIRSALSPYEEQLKHEIETMSIPSFMDYVLDTG